MIYGTDKSFIQFGDATILMPHSVTNFDLLQNQDIRHRSILTGKRTTSRKADYAEFTVTDKLFKYSSPTAQFNLLRGLIDEQVQFYFQGSTVIADCYVMEAKPYYMRNLINYDLMTLVLLPINYLTISNYMYSEDGQIMLNEDGTPMRTEGISI